MFREIYLNHRLNYQGVNSSHTPVPPPDLTHPNINVTSVPPVFLPFPPVSKDYDLENQAQITDETKILFGESSEECTPTVPDDTQENIDIDEQTDENGVSGEDDNPVNGSVQQLTGDTDSEKEQRTFTTETVTNPSSCLLVQTTYLLMNV